MPCGGTNVSGEASPMGSIIGGSILHWANLNDNSPSFRGVSAPIEILTGEKSEYSFIPRRFPGDT